MPLPVIGSAVLFVLVLLLGAGCVRSMRARGGTQPPVTTQAVRSLSRQQILERLKTLETSEAPAPTMGAMCYIGGMPPEHQEYVCPKCGERTLYSQCGFVQWSLDRCRQEFDALRQSSELQVSLSESTYCSHCTPDAKEHHLALTVTLADGKRHTTAPVGLDDLRMLRSFLTGLLSVEEDQEGTHPLKRDLPRLRELLGVAPVESRPKKTDGQFEIIIETYPQNDSPKK